MNPPFLLSRGHISGVIGQAEEVGVNVLGAGWEEGGEGRARGGGLKTETPRCRWPYWKFERKKGHFGLSV